MRIVFNAWRDTSHPLAGGSEVMIDRVAAGLHQRGHDVELRAGQPITTHDYAVRDGGGKFGQYLSSPATYARHHRRVDLVVDLANGMTFYTPLWRRRPTICFVHHVHTEQWSQWFPAPMAALGRSLERWAMPQVYRGCLFVTVSDSSAAALVALGVDRDRIRIVPNGVDLGDEQPVKAAEPTFVALGRLVPHKQYHLMAEAWKQVQPITGGRLLLIGEGPEQDRIEAVGAPAMELLGRVSDEERDRLLGEAWLLIHPSMLEGWGLVVMEAAAHSTPTLGFDAPGVRDSVVHTETGMLARTAAELVEFWTELGLDHDLRTKLGAGARQRADLFSWDQTIDQFEAVMVEATSRRSRFLRPYVPRPGNAPPVASRAGLLRLFLNRKVDPAALRTELAQRSVAELGSELHNRLILDLGCGPGYGTRALRDAGAQVVPLDLDSARPTVIGEPLQGRVQADAHGLPFADASFDGIHCSDLPDNPEALAPLLNEIERVLKLGGWAWLSVPDAYHGVWPTHVGPILDIVDRQRGLRLVAAKPRYWPSQQWILKVPGLREVATGNCVLELVRIARPPSP